MAQTTTRKVWMTICEITTFLVPNFLLSKDEEQRQAWREKITLFFWILVFSGSIIFIIGILPGILCPKEQYFTWSDIWDKETSESWVVAHGYVYDVKDQIEIQDDQETFLGYLGQDISELYVKPLPEKIEEIQYNSTKYELFKLVKNEEKCVKPGDSFLDEDANEVICQDVSILKNRIGTLSLSIEDLKVRKNKHWFFIYNKVYDFSRYLTYADTYGMCLPPVSDGFSNIEYCSENYRSLPFVDEECGNICQRDKECYFKLNTFLNCNITEISSTVGNDTTLTYEVENYLKTDALYLDSRLNKMFLNKQELNATKYFENVFPEQDRSSVLQYLDDLYFIGVLDTRYILICEILDITFLTIICIVAFIIVFKFLSSLFVLAKQYPEQNDKYVIINMPCYTETLEEIEKTIYSVMELEYPDNYKKLLLIVADGIVTGKGNDKPTCELVLNIFGRSLHDQKETYEYKSLSSGELEKNRAKVFSGIYTDPENKIVLPYMVIVKVGNSKEKSKPGNRGKRDSQMVLFNFLSNVFYKSPFNDLENKIYDDMEGIINSNPEDYEFLMCIDSDTEPAEDSLKQMVFKMCNDNKIIGLCGETRIANKYDSWVTAIQVYEYYINHHLNKAFESLFGNVTCLPGCFSMYRIKSFGKKRKAFVINRDILEQYSTTVVNTLHTKNLLHLGEDRYLTTLLTKQFPNYSLKYITEAVCETVVPNSWSILLSQRRRWVNSTVHNLLELVQIQGMCGIAFFSMRFIVLLDLIATFFLPASICYLYYLIYLFASGQEKIQLIMIVVLSIVYGVQILVFLIKRQLEYFIWLVIYILAMPIWNIIIPIYSFWKFDDFSWGKTRELSGTGTHSEYSDSPTESQFDDLKNLNLPSVPSNSPTISPVSSIPTFPSKPESVYSNSIYDYYEGFHSDKKSIYSDKESIHSIKSDKESIKSDKESIHSTKKLDKNTKRTSVLSFKSALNFWKNR